LTHPVYYGTQNMMRIGTGDNNGLGPQGQGCKAKAKPNISGLRGEVSLCYSRTEYLQIGIIRSFAETNLC